LQLFLAVPQSILFLLSFYSSAVAVVAAVVTVANAQAVAVQAGSSKAQA
jgi:hypothetical protein